MKLSLLAFLALVLAGCDQGRHSQQEFVPSTVDEEWKVNTALYLFRTLENYNYDYAAENYLADPESVEPMKRGQGQIMADSYRVIDVNDEGVVMAFSTHCYPDIQMQVYMKRLAAGYRVEFERTMRAFLGSGSREPTQKYCYEFIDQPLQGSIVGYRWIFDRVGQRSASESGFQRREIDLLDERCDNYPDCLWSYSNRGAGPILSISSLDMTGDGGNLDGTHYVVVNWLGMDSINLHKGSYRVAHLGGERIRLELAIPPESSEEAVELNGFIEFDLSNKE